MNACTIISLTKSSEKNMDCFTFEIEIPYNYSITFIKERIESRFIIDVTHLKSEVGMTKAHQIIHQLFLYLREKSLYRIRAVTENWMYSLKSTKRIQ